MFKFILGTLFFFGISLCLYSQNWQQIGPNGGYFKEFTFSPVNSSIIYAGSDDGGGVWKSIDDGATWSLLTGDYPNMTGWKIRLDPNSPDTLFACDMYGRYGLLKSMDGGTTWSNPISGLDAAYDKMVSGLALINSDTLLISTGESATSIPPRPGNGVFRSFNGGNTWTPTGLQGMTIPSIANNIFGTIFAGTESDGLYYSNDFGSNWTIHPDISAVAICREIEIKDSIVLIGSSTGVYLSTNYGMNFTNLGLSGQFNFDVAIHKVLPDIEVYSSTITGLQHYSTGTGTWTVVAEPELAGQLVIGIQSDGTNIYTSTFSNSLILKSSDSGTSWNLLANTPQASEVNALFIDPLNSDRILTGMMGSYSFSGAFNKMAVRETNDGGLSWISKGPNAHALSLAANPLNSNTIYLGTYVSGLFKTDDSFNSFTSLISGNKLIGDIAISSSDTNVVLISEVDFDLSTSSIKRSIDGGNSFTTSVNLIANRILFNTISNDTVYAATDNGVYLSIDNGVSWNSWLLAGDTILSIHYSDGILFAGNNLGTVYKIENSSSVNISGPWQTPIEIKNIYTINNELFVGLNGAERDTIYDLFGSIWRGDLNGSIWMNITDQMTSVNIYGNKVISSDGNELYVGTYGGGIFKSDGLSLSIEVEPIDNGFILFPNPSAKYATINSNYQNISDIVIFNLLGQDVSRLVDISSPGENSVSLDLFRLKNGSYIVQINGTHTIKLCKQ